MSGAELLSWYSIGFVAVFVLGVVLLLIGLLGLGGDSDVSHDVSGHDVGEAAHDGDGNHGAHSALLDFLGIGRCPLSIVLMVLCFLFALGGIATVIILRMFYVPGLVVGAVAYPVATVFSFMMSGAVARLIGRIMPTSETYVESESHHIGSLGKAIYGFDNGQGFVQIRDRSGTIHEVKATSPDDETIAAGAAVLVLDYDEGNRTFRVQLAPSELAPKGT